MRARHPLLAVRPEKRILVVVVTADRGLAGGFNANLIKLAQRFVDEHTRRGTELRTDRAARAATISASARATFAASISTCSAT